MEKLSDSLQQRVLCIKNKKVLQSFKLLKENFDDKTLEKMGAFVQNLIIEPNEVIYKKFEQPDDDEMYIYFLLKGEIQLRRDREINSVIAVLKNGYFGENGFFFGEVIYTIDRFISFFFVQTFTNNFIFFHEASKLFCYHNKCVPDCKAESD